MPRQKSRANTFPMTIYIPNEFRDDLKLLARYNYTSVSAEINAAIREHMEKNHELIQHEKANQPSS